MFLRRIHVHILSSVYVMNRWRNIPRCWFVYFRWLVSASSTRRLLFMRCQVAAATSGVLLLRPASVEVWELHLAQFLRLFVVYKFSLLTRIVWICFAFDWNSFSAMTIRWLAFDWSSNRLRSSAIVGLTYLRMPFVLGCVCNSSALQPTRTQQCNPSVCLAFPRTLSQSILFFRCM